MSILDFAKHLGRQVFDRDDVAADKIKQELDIRLSGIKNLDVQFDDGVVTLCGDCVVKGDREQAILIAGNIKGVERVIADQLNAPKPPPEAPPEPEEKEEFYEIQKGDTLGAIAKRYYGKASQYTRIFEANRNVIDDPDKIYPGQKIRIPLD
jgi:LysM repeat protein